MTVRNVRLLLPMILTCAGAGLVGCNQPSSSSSSKPAHIAKKAPPSDRRYEGNWDEEETSDIDSDESQSQPHNEGQTQNQAQEQQQIQKQEQIEEQGDSSVARVSVRAPLEEQAEEPAQRSDRPRVKTIEAEPAKPDPTIAGQAAGRTTTHDSTNAERSSHEAPATDEVPPQDSGGSRPSERGPTDRMQINRSSVASDEVEIEDRDIDIQSQENRVYVGAFQPLNAGFYSQPIAGSVRIETQMGEVSIDLTVTGLRNDTRHLVQMYSNSICPPIDRSDFNNDGIIDVIEATSVVGKILFPFDTPLANIAVNRDIHTGLMTDEDGEVAFETSASISKIENALRRGTVATDLPIARFGPNERLDFENRVIIVHGIPRVQTLPISVQSFGTLPATMTVPIACAEINVVQVDSVDGEADPQTSDIQNELGRDEEDEQTDAAAVDLSVRPDTDTVPGLNPATGSSSEVETDVDVDSDVANAPTSDSDVLR